MFSIILNVSDFCCSNTDLSAYTVFKKPLFKAAQSHMSSHTRSKEMTMHFNEVILNLTPDFLKSHFFGLPDLGFSAWVPPDSEHMMW